MSFTTTEKLYAHFLQSTGVETDTRKIGKGQIFFALKGPSFNGNSFASQALALGAAFAVVDEVEFVTDNRILLVEDVLSSLQALAKHHRNTLSIPVIGITGSNGKTTTKELVHAVLSRRFVTSTTQGNLNNHIGIPLTLLRIPQNAQIAVIEMGANHQKEIEGYCTYVQPTHGLITNIGKAHLEGFGGIEGVKKGKGELFDFLRAHHGMVWVHTDSPELRSISRELTTVIGYGTTSGAVQGQVVSAQPFLTIQITSGLSQTSLIQTQLVGDYNLPNVLAAVAVGVHFGVPDQQIIAAIENYCPSNSRSQLMRIGHNDFILDAYNANPSSMKAAIENFAQLPAQQKVLLLGAMKELGPESIAEHQALSHLIAQYNWEAVVLVGGDFLHIKTPFTVLETTEAAKDWLQAQNWKEATILVKGSRGMQMEKVLPR